MLLGVIITKLYHIETSSTKIYAVIKNMYTPNIFFEKKIFLVKMR